MKSNAEILEHLKKIFPGLEPKIDQLYANDEDFRSLCEDYFYCLRDLHKFKRLSEVEKRTVEEYENVKDTLEKEIFDSLFP